MKKVFILLITFTALFFSQHAQSQTAPKAFTGAEATLDNYKALYELNSSDTKTITATLRNINNALEDPRLKGKLEVELIAFGDGLAVYQKDNSFEEALKKLEAKGVILAACQNTIRERKIDTNKLFSFISFVPSGNGEIIIRQYQGWAVLHP